ncbi:MULTISPECIES: hypothetical protein [Pseudomonas]|uniref:hypothetical protein n=1 Tax=Pseudomonas TaxID=286 RepID=UPI0002A3B5FD|nr:MULTISPECIES: hypothetical protein [Pseudomonas]AMO75162.1 hypothetical protein PcP3B5_16960 [Pseudomonas citronellolis]UNY87528.1 hypothetical protein MRY70_21845 [Pseudomonas sp. M1]
MTSFFPFRLAWAALAGGVLLALLWQPRAAIPEAPAETAQWRLPEVRPVSRNASIPAQIASMAWWGSAREEAEKARSARISVDEQGVARVKVQWLFRGVVAEGGQRFALIAKDAAAPLLRYAPGDQLPGGERLERIEGQGIRFSLSEDGATQDFERKLYAPLE